MPKLGCDHQQELSCSIFRRILQNLYAIKLPKTRLSLILLAIGCISKRKRLAAGTIAAYFTEQCL